MGTVLIFDAETFGLSPAKKTFSILKIGTFDSARLTIEFTESFGYGLKEAFLNGIRLPAQSSSSLIADVKNFLKQGENKLVVEFNHIQIAGIPLGQTTISARIVTAGGSIQEIPSTTQFLDEIGNFFSKNVNNVAIILVTGAVALGSLAYISTRLPNFGGIKISNNDLSKIKNTAKSRVNSGSGFLKKSVKRFSS